MCVNLDRWEVRDIVKKVKDGEGRALEEAIRFLNDDEISQGSGYAKEYLWRAMAKASLTQRQKERLQSSAIKYLSRRITRDFWPMCRTLAVIADDNFRNKIDRYVNTEQGIIVQRALFLQAFLKGLGYGEQYRNKYFDTIEGRA